MGKGYFFLYIWQPKYLYLIVNVTFWYLSLVFSHKEK